MLTANPFVLPDAELERLACHYQALPLTLRRQYTFGEYLCESPTVRADTCVLAIAVVRRRVEDLLQHQEQVRLERAGACCANGHLVEKLRHHRHPRSCASFAAKRTA